MTKPTVLANAVTTVWGIAYALCGLVAMFMPGLYFGVLDNWFHSINLQLIKSTTPFSLTVFITGLVTFALYVWVITFATATVYNMMAKKK